MRKNHLEHCHRLLRSCSASLQIVGFAIVLSLLQTSSAVAQGSTTTTVEVSLGQTLSELTQVIVVREVGESLRFNTALEVASAPLGTSSGGFAFKLDPTTGLEVRQAATFGPSFAERVITQGAGKMSVSGSLIAATYDKLGELDLDQMELIHQRSATSPPSDQRGVMSLVLNSETYAIQGVMGATDKLDVGGVVPIVRIRLDAVSFIQDGNGNVLVRAAGKGSSTGLGDIALQAKYRLLRFGGDPPPDAPVEPDPGGFAVQVVGRLPTGSRENLRGLGIYRVLSSLIFSSGKGKFRPHGQVGYEWWSKGIDIESDFDPTVTAKNSFQYAAGVEFAAAPTLTLIVDFLTRQVNGGGKVGSNTVPVNDPRNPEVDSLSYALALPEGILKQSIVPGLKWNLKGKFLLSLNAIIAVRDNGLYDKFTPVVGLDFTF